MEKVIVNGREYKVLKIYKKKLYEQDVFLCQDIKTGYKECFLRGDIQELIQKVEAIRKKKLGIKQIKWKKEEIEYIYSETKKGTPRRFIAAKFPERTEGAVYYYVAKARAKYGITGRTYEARSVRQYDTNMNLIATYPTINAAARAMESTPSMISRCCKGKAKTVRGYIWKYEVSKK